MLKIFFIFLRVWVTNVILFTKKFVIVLASGIFLNYSQGNVHVQESWKKYLDKSLKLLQDSLILKIKYFKQNFDFQKCLRNQGEEPSLRHEPVVGQHRSEQRDVPEDRQRKFRRPLRQQRRLPGLLEEAPRHRGGGQRLRFESEFTFTNLYLFQNFSAKG